MQSTPSPLAEHRDSSADGVDADLASLPRPPRRSRTLALVAMGAAAVCAGAMTAYLSEDVRYALGSPAPVDLGSLAEARPERSNVFVEGEGRLDRTRAVRYSRPFERDTFELAPVAGADGIWVEMRRPTGGTLAGAEPTAFVGRLVQVGRSPAPGGGPLRAWVLFDGVTPRSLGWTAPLAGLFAALALWCAVNIVRIARPVRS